MAAAARAIAGLLVVASLAVGCVRREGMNFDCIWPAEPIARLDVGNPDHRRHLRADLEVAEELAVRYMDRSVGRDPHPVLGIVRLRLGSENELMPEGQRIKDRCLDSLATQIAWQHSLTTGDVHAGFEGLHVKDPVAEILVAVPLPVMFLALSAIAVRRIRSRFSADEPGPIVVATVFAAVVVMTCVLAVDLAWAWVFEVVRLGNEHLSHRGLRPYFPQRHGTALFIAGCATFVAIAATDHARRQRRPTNDP